MNKDSKIYVAGHTGLVGSALLRKLKKEGYTNILTRSHRELDLLDQKAVASFFEKEKPEYVLLAAARVGGIMATLNRDASREMLKRGVHACTDVTGFGLVGHALEMAQASGVTLELELE